MGAVGNGARRQWGLQAMVLWGQGLRIKGL